MNLDPITNEVVRNRLREVAAVMAHALYHTGYSPILRESQDGAAGLTDINGHGVAVGGGVPFHCFLYSTSIAGILERYPLHTMREGDAFLSNDPYKVANSHVPDTVVAAPVFHRDRIIGFAITMAHKADVGGLVPGSSGAAAREIFHDGLLIPPVRYWTRDGVASEVEALVCNNSRVPEEIAGDIRGQVGATLLGTTKLRELCDEYGVDTVTAVMGQLIESTADRFRRELAAWPDGAAGAEGRLDHDGVDKTSPVVIRVRATKTGDRLQIDFTGTSIQARGPVNALQVTAQAASLIAAVAVIDPTMPINWGVRQAVDFVMPPGTLVTPKFPATINNYFPTVHLVYNCVLTALGKLNPKRATAPSGLGSGAMAIGYTRDRTGKPAVQYELMKLALGASQHHDGVTIGGPMHIFTPGTPIEILESEYPVTVKTFGLSLDSAGAGRRRGGVGYVREYEVLDNCILTVRCTNYREGSWGVLGGSAPRRSQATFLPRDADKLLLDCLDTQQMRPGDRVRFEQSGGGGYGPPHERSVAEVVDDVRSGYVSLKEARDIYGVYLTAEGDRLSCDEVATHAARSGAKA